MKTQSLAGQTFGHLTVIEKTPNPNEKNSRWFCRCACGKIVNVSRVALVQGSSKSCGCNKNAFISERNGTHHMSKTREFEVWTGMFGRCYNPINRKFSSYGERGIRVCERWKEFVNFYADMGPRPSPKHSLGRIDNNGNYYPENCRWETTSEQARNTQRSRRFTFNGETLVVTDWAKRYGLKHSTLNQRLKRGWPIEKALTTPVQK